MDLSKRYDVLSRLTAFVAIEERSSSESNPHALPLDRILGKFQVLQDEFTALQYAQFFFFFEFLFFFVKVDELDTIPWEERENGKEKELEEAEEKDEAAAAAEKLRSETKEEEKVREKEPPLEKSKEEKVSRSSSSLVSEAVSLMMTSP